jgi:hypothetical protein
LLKEDIGMTRLTLALAAWIALASAAPAVVTPRKEHRGLPSEIPPTPAARVSPSAAARTASPVSPAEYVLTEQTETLLDGKPCRFENVPEGASILRMEVAADGKTVLKVLFKSRK